MTRRFGVLMTMCLAAVALDARQTPSTGRALTIEDYYRVQSIGGPQFSPDARWILFSVTTRVEENQTTRSEAYFVPTDGSAPPSRLRHDGQDVASASWTPEGRLRYTAASQSWTIDPASPNTAAIVAPAGTPGGGRAGGRGGGRGGGGQPASSGFTSPDGRAQLLLVDKPRPAAPAPAMTEFEKRHEGRFRGAIFDWMEFQRDGQAFPAPNLAVRPGQQIVWQPQGTADDSMSARRVLVDLDIRPTAVTWHPSGAFFAFLADTTWRDELKYERPDIWIGSADGTLTRVTDDGYVHADLEFSPDGKYLSYARSFGTDMIIDKKLNHGGPRDFFIRAVDGGRLAAAVNLTAKWDLEPGNAQWAPDSRAVYYTAAVGGETHLFRLSVPDGQITQVTKGARRINNLTYSRDFTMIAYTVGAHDTPGDVYVARIDGTGERKLSDVHAATTKEIAFSKTDRLRWPSYDGTQIEGWLTYPYGYDPSTPRSGQAAYPLIVFSHGGPHSATGYSFDFKKQFFAANGYFVFDTNFRSSTGYGDAFKWATWGAWGDKDGQDVMSGIDYVIKRYPIDPARVGHTGHSYGGFMTNWLITQYPDRFAAAVSGAGISNWISDYGTADIYRTKETEFFGTPWEEAARERMIRQSPITYAGRVKTPTLFVHGEVDQRVPYEEAEQMYFALKRRGIPAKMIQYAGQPHGIGGHWNNVHRMLNELRWWDTYLKPKAPAR